MKPESITVLGVDPGAKGGWALLVGETSSIENSSVITYDKFRDSESFLEQMKRLDTNHSIDKVIIEKVHAHPQQGVSSTFKFAANFGFEKGVLASIFGWELVEEIMAQKWQQYLEIPKSESKTEHKNKLKEKAQEFWPDCRWTLATCDAPWLALWGILRYNE